VLFRISNIEKKKAALDYLSRLPFIPEMTVEIKPYKRNRSLAQNRLYWMWMHEMAGYTGYDEQELHLLFRERWLGYEPVEIKGRTVHTLKSTTELTVQQFTDYLNRVSRLAYYLDVILPYPDDADLALGIK
jgi:hypothetical protein